MKCGQCGQEMPEQGARCYRCGAARSAPPTRPCPGCGRKIAERLQRCQFCGKVLAAAPAPAPPEDAEPVIVTRGGSVEKISDSPEVRSKFMAANRLLEDPSEMNCRAALSLLAQAEKLDPRCPYVFMDKGLALAALEKWKEGLQALDQAVNLSKPDSELRAHLELIREGVRNRSRR